MDTTNKGKTLLNAYGALAGLGSATGAYELATNFDHYAGLPTTNQVLAGGLLTLMTAASTLIGINAVQDRRKKARETSSLETELN
mgnify:CR=1 FL=1